MDGVVLVHGNEEGLFTIKLSNKILLLLTESEGSPQLTAIQVVLCQNRQHIKHKIMELLNFYTSRVSKNWLSICTAQMGKKDRFSLLWSRCSNSKTKQKVFIISTLSHLPRENQKLVLFQASYNTLIRMTLSESSTKKSSSKLKVCRPYFSFMMDSRHISNQLERILESHDLF